jgi:hypothetical protein
VRQAFFANMLGALSVSGCLAASPREDITLARPSVILPELSDTCGRDDLTDYIGQAFTEIADVQIPGDIRIIRPGRKVDGYVSPSRLNVQVDSTGVIRRLSCG